MGLEKLKNSIFGNKEEEIEEEDNDMYTGKKSSKDALREVGGDGNKMILFEPRAYSESQQIADYLKSSNAVIVNLKRVTPDQAKRIVDFLSGTIYAISGDLQKLGGGIFLCTPNSVNVEGKISDEGKEKNGKGQSSKVKGQNEEDKEKEEDEYNW